MREFFYKIAPDVLSIAHKEKYEERLTHSLRNLRSEDCKHVRRKLSKCLKMDDWKSINHESDNLHSVSKEIIITIYKDQKVILYQP